MNLDDYLDAIDVQLELTRYPNQDGRWCAHFESCEIKEGGGLTSAHGNGPSPSEAIADYLEQIRGKRIVFNAMSKELRREFTVPQQIAAAESRAKR